MLDRIRLLVLDVDGVLTDGRIIYDSAGAETKVFHAADGQGLKYWLRAGHQAAILSGREGEAVQRRADELGIELVRMGAKDKLPAFEELLQQAGATAKETACMGDDLVDLPVLARAGFAVAVPAAPDEVRRVAHYVTRAPGGAGAVREVIELVLKYQDRWADVTRRYEERLPADLPGARRPWRPRP